MITNSGVQLEKKRKSEAFSDAGVNRLSNAFHYSTDAIVLTDKGGIIQDINPAFTRMYGYSAEEVKGKTNRVLRSTVPKPFFYEDMWVALLKEKQWKGELFNRRKDGKELPVYLSITPIYENEDLTGYMGLSIDLSDKYRIGKELDLQRRFSESLLSTANSLIVSLDRKGKILMFNKMCEEVLEYNESEVLGKDWIDIFLPESKKPNLRSVFEQLIETGRPEHYENEIITKSGVSRTVLWSNTTLKDDSGDVIGTLSIGQDVTEFLILKKKIGRSEQLAVLGQLAAGIAHEVGNPLTSIASLVQLLQRSHNEQDLKEKLDMIMSQTKRITQIIRDLVDFSRPSESVEEITDINKQIEKAVRIIRIDDKSKDIKFELDLSPDIGHPFLIPDQFFQVILNLLLNAVDASIEHGGTISIRSYKRDGAVQVNITDNGTGISPDEIDRIFEPFYTTKEVGKGTGLGLWVSNGIINSFGGNIEVESEVYKETTFTISIPVGKNGG
ncbi:MAG: PAS domain S-box protein [Thermodesulfobacteriota bacterium]